MAASIKTVFLCLTLTIVLATKVASGSHEKFKVTSVTFLVTVNDTWYPDEYNKTCMATVKTPALQPGVKYNDTMQIHVGDCDHGPLMFTLSDDGTIDVVFYSSVIEDAAHPECQIPWHFDYQSPTAKNPGQCPLPGCFVADSREGYHMTDYWFYVFDWSFNKINTVK